jgi:hypothetical protein
MHTAIIGLLLLAGDLVLNAGAGSRQLNRELLGISKSFKVQVLSALKL